MTLPAMSLVAVFYWNNLIRKSNMLLPTGPDFTNSADAAQRSHAQTSSQRQRGLPVIIVRFWQRDL